jgi:hypothetical protein
MPARATIDRIGKTDFLAIMAPGFFLLAVIIFAGAAINESFRLVATDSRSEDSLSRAEIRAATQQTTYLEFFTSQWPLTLVAVIFATYVVGSIPRAMAVNTADRLCAACFFWVPRRPWDQLLFQGDFPYRSALKETFKVLKINGMDRGASFPKKGTSHTLFNAWKVTICHEAPNAFAYTQLLEARTRLFAGMFWAGAVGVVVSACLFLTFVVLLLHRWWWIAAVVIAVLGVLALILAWSFSDRDDKPTSSKAAQEIRVVGSLRFPRRFKLFLGFGIGSLSMCSIWGVAVISNPWVQWTTLILLASLAIAFCFGFQLRRVRGQESDALFLTYVSLNHRDAQKRTKG